MTDMEARIAELRRTADDFLYHATPSHYFLQRAAAELRHLADELEEPVHRHRYEESK